MHTLLCVLSACALHKWYRCTNAAQLAYFQVHTSPRGINCCKMTDSTAGFPPGWEGEEVEEQLNKKCCLFCLSPWPSFLWLHWAFPHPTLPSMPSYLFFLGEATGSLCARTYIRATVGLSYPFTHLAIPECNGTQPAIPDKQPQPPLHPSWPYCDICQYELYSVLFSRCVFLIDTPGIAHRCRFGVMEWTCRNNEKR